MIPIPMPTRGMRRVPRNLGPRPAGDPDYERDHAEYLPWNRQNMRDFDNSDEVWRALWRDYGVETVEEVVASKGGMTTAREVRDVLQRRLGVPR